jgi:hypothetical protein
MSKKDHQLFRREIFWPAKQQGKKSLSRQRSAIKNLACQPRRLGTPDVDDINLM